MLDLARFRVLTFDCYGTLIDWESGILAALRPLLAAHAQDLPDESILQTYASLEAEAERSPYRPYRDVLATVADGFGERLGFTPTPAERAALAASVPHWPPFPDTVAALQALARRFALIAVSNIDDNLFAASARRLQVPFTAAVTAEQAGSYKPAPRHFELALQRASVPKAQVLHVAQSLYHDIAPAQALGLATVWVNRRGGRPGFGATPPAQARPDLQVPDLATLAAAATG